MDIIIFLLQCVWFMLPAYFANMAPVFAARFKILERLSAPVDFGRKLGSMPLFGKGKTWRGFVVGAVLAIIIVSLQRMLYGVPFFQKISFVDYSKMNFVLFGFLLGFGALFGDLVKSFFKRRFKIKTGASWVPFDQIDYSIGALVFVSLVYILPVLTVITILVSSFILHIALNHIGYYLRIKDTKW